MDHQYEELRHYFPPFVAKGVIEIIRDSHRQRNGGLKDEKKSSEMDGETVIEIQPDHGLIVLSSECL